MIYDNYHVIDVKIDLISSSLYLECCVTRLHVYNAVLTKQFRPFTSKVAVSLLITNARHNTVKQLFIF